MDIYNGGTANSTTVNSAGSMYISSGGIHRGSLQLESGATISAYSGAIIDFTLTDRTVNDGYLINDLSLITGAPTYTITISASQESGTYKLAGNAASLDQVTLTLKVENSASAIAITVGDTSAITQGEKILSLYLDASDNLIFDYQVLTNNPFDGQTADAPDTLTVMRTGQTFAGGSGALLENDYLDSTMIFGGKAAANNDDIFFYVKEVNNENLMVFGGSLQQDVDGNIYMAVEDAALHSIYGGSYQGDTGTIDLQIKNSTAEFIYASAMGTADGTEITISGSVSVNSEIQGSTLNANNTGDSIITINGGNYGGNDYFMVYTG